MNTPKFQTWTATGYIYQQWTVLAFTSIENDNSKKRVAVDTGCICTYLKQFGVFSETMQVRLFNFGMILTSVEF